MQIICGKYNNILLNDNKIYVCGDNSYGQLGLGDKYDRHMYEMVKYKFGNIVQVRCADYHSMIMTDNKGQNELYVCGNNFFGQLGLNDNVERNQYIKLENNFGVITNFQCCNCKNIILNSKNELYISGDTNNLYDHPYNRFIYNKINHKYGKIIDIIVNNTKMDYVIINDQNDIFIYNKKINFKFGKIKQLVYNDRYSMLLNDKNELYYYKYDVNHMLIDDNNIIRYTKFNIFFENIIQIFIKSDVFIISNHVNDNLYIYSVELNDLIYIREKPLFVRINICIDNIVNIIFNDIIDIIINDNDGENGLHVRGSNNNGQLGFGDTLTRNIYEKINLDFIVRNYKFRFTYDEQIVL